MTDAILNNVAERRKLLGKTQEDLAIAVGVSRQTIIALEKGNYVPSLLLALKIAEYFEVKIEELFTVVNQDN